MQKADELRQEHDGQDRLSRLSEAILRINDSLDFETVLQEILDSARSLTGAMCGVVVLLDEMGGIQDFHTSGLTPEEAQQMSCWTGGVKLFGYLSRTSEPLRLRDFHRHTRALGLPDFYPPRFLGTPLSFLGVPIRQRSESVGNFFLSEKEGGREFTSEDEETLVIFASQAAMVIANARRYKDEQRARRDLETLVSTSPIGAVILNANTGAIVSVNREAHRIVGGLRNPGDSLEQLLAVMSFRRADGRETSLNDFPLAKALSDAETIRAEEIVLLTPDGRMVTTLVNATPIRSEGGDIESVVVTLQDMTDLENLERLRAEFLGMVSHELRTPLTSIKGSVDTLMEDSADLDPAEIRQFLRIIRDQTDSMRYLVTDLLDVARVETGTLPVVLEPTDVRLLVEQARNRFLSAGNMHNLSIDLTPDLPLVMADKRRMTQVLGNLLHNAARHADESVTIRLRAVQEDFHIAISVTDDGVGISGERLPYLFSKFSRMEGDDRRRALEGSGLGLFICKGIVEAHGGRIWAESDGLGQGARFTFTIPVAPELAVTGSVQPSTRRRQAAAEQERVLVVDDDPQMLRYVRDALSKAGYAPIVTADPKEVLHLVEASKPHLILLDLLLPGTDGIELMKDILEEADVPIIFLSAYGQDQVIARAFERGATDYVVKPFSPTELMARIRAALRRHAMPELAEPTEPYVLGKLTINYAQREVTVAMRPITLTAIEYRLLFELSVNAGKVLTYSHLLQRVWGLMRHGDLRPMRTVVRNLRRKLGDDANNPTYIFTEPRVGYRMVKAHEPRQATTKAP